ncbi:MAG: hypothetical protein IJX94_05885, partial [Clostridia bacterium]|nr:hypothetical protein [Clostridia bacterium]
LIAVATSATTIYLVFPNLIQKANNKILLWVAVQRAILKLNTYRQEKDREFFAFSVLFSW